MKKNIAGAAGLAILMVGAFVAPFLMRELQATRADSRNSSAALRVASRSGRPEPLAFGPHGDFAAHVDRANLAQILYMNLPRFHSPGIPLILHMARLWGPEVDFGGQTGVGHEHDQMLTGRQMVDCLRDIRIFHELGGKELDDLLLLSEHGIRVVTNQDRTMETRTASTHPDKYLQVMGECGMPLSTPVATRSGATGTLRDILQDSLLRFSMGQELEFTASAYSRYLPPQANWINRFGQECSMDQVARSLASRPFGRGACDGMHVPFALVNLRRADLTVPFLQEATRLRIAARLREYADQLTRTQLDCGGWDRNWSGDPQTTEAPYTIPIDRMAATGHHLEWIALAPPGERPADEVITRAIRYLGAHVASLSQGTEIGFHARFPLTHAGRAMALLAGVEPREFLTQEIAKKR